MSSTATSLHTFETSSLVAPENSTPTSTSTSTSTSTRLPTVNVCPTTSPSSSTVDSSMRIATSASTSTSTSTSTFNLKCADLYPSANCDDSTRPIFSGNFNLNDTLDIPVEIDTVTILGNFSMQSNSQISVQVESVNNSDFRQPVVKILGIFYADGTVSLSLPNFGNFEIFLFEFEQMIGDIQIQLEKFQLENVKRQTPCQVTPARSRTEFRVKIVCDPDLQVENSKPAVFSVGEIVGIIVGAFVLLVVVAVVVVLLLRRNRKNKFDRSLEIPMNSARNITMRDMTLSDVHVEKRLGAGNFGEVYSGYWAGTRVALKRTKEENDIEFLAEISTLSEVIHPNVVQYYGVAAVDDRMYIVMEWMPLGSLVDIIKSISETSTLVDIALQCCAGMMHLSEKKIIHRDIALRNVLIAQSHQQKYVAKMADFGMARIIPDGDYSSDGSVFPVKWCAPEIIDHRQFSVASDVWAFGIMLWELFSEGDKPYSGMTLRETAAFVSNGKTMDAPSDAPLSIQKAMRQCWAKEAKDRPTFSEVHSLLKTAQKELN
eukprot:TRINITY_DN9582_c0_g1_i2.p1 TRINITY_DN9582_c0_g1~~TRINITY_DN9582_c0_g1_i2.p1  ORF type:complete len:544 (+),score=199.25 TRINITY_DN9582_c0_g1_i2:932-2563(+)